MHARLELDALRRQYLLHTLGFFTKLYKDGMICHFVHAARSSGRSAALVMAPFSQNLSVLGIPFMLSRRRRPPPVLRHGPVDPLEWEAQLCKSLLRVESKRAVRAA